MHTIKVKIVDFDENSQSLIACFSSDETASNNPEDYMKLAYQPATMFPSANTDEEIRKELAKMGMSVAADSKVQEELKLNTARVAQYKSLVGTEQEFNVSDLQPSSDSTPSVEV